MREFIIYIPSFEKDERFKTQKQIKHNDDLELFWDTKKNKIGLKVWNASYGTTFKDMNWEEIEIQTFDYIQKNTSDGKKIYEDCTVFEIGRTGLTRGYYTYNKITMKYEIQIVDENGKKLNKRCNNLNNVKFIKKVNTLQELERR